MNETIRPYLICYDISSPKRLSRAAKFLASVGTRVQKSVYEIMAGQLTIAFIANRLNDIVDAEKDALAIYPIDARALKKADRHLAREGPATFANTNDVYII